MRRLWQFSAPKPERKSDWVLTQNAFRQLLDWLDEGLNSDGSRYLEIRRRLVLYFDRKNCLTPDELADETLNRVARRIEEEGGISTDTPAHYCYIVARFVLLEDLRRSPQKQLDEHVVRLFRFNRTTTAGRTEISMFGTMHDNTRFG